MNFFNTVWGNQAAMVTADRGDAECVKNDALCSSVLIPLDVESIESDIGVESLPQESSPLLSGKIPLAIGLTVFEVVITLVLLAFGGRKLGRMSE